MLYQFLPRLSDDEYQSLEDSIREHGVQVPIVIDENRSIIDGHHRAEIAERLGIECPRKFALDLTDEQKRTLALSLNLDRRHLSREQKRQLIASSVKADPHLSNRQHAERTGVDHKTVGSVRNHLEATGEIPQSEVRVSADGHIRPATQPARPTPEPPAIDIDRPTPRAVVGIDGKTYPARSTRPARRETTDLPEWSNQDRAEELAQGLAGHIAAMWALTIPERRAEYIHTWKLGTRESFVLGADYITPENFRAISAALLTFANEWEQHHG